MADEAQMEEPFTDDVCTHGSAEEVAGSSPVVGTELESQSVVAEGALVEEAGHLPPFVQRMVTYKDYEKFASGETKFLAKLARSSRYGFFGGRVEFSPLLQRREVMTHRPTSRMMSRNEVSTRYDISSQYPETIRKE